jgi:AraC family transcriptional regulator
MQNDAGHSVDAFAAATMARSAGAFRAFACSFGANAVLPRHAHDSPTLFIVIAGSLTERVGNRTHACDPGSVLLKGSSYEHSDRIGDRGLKVVGLEFCAPAGFRDGSVFPNDVLWHAQSSAILTLGHRIREELTAGDDAADLALESVALDLFSMRLRASRHHPRNEPPWLRQLVTRLHDSPIDQLPSLSTVARETGLHAVYIARAFRSHMGCSLGTYVRRIRLDGAAVHLKHRGASIAEVAHAAGFADQSHFARAFRRRYGVSPSSYR